MGGHEPSMRLSTVGAAEREPSAVKLTHGPYKIDLLLIIPWKPAGIPCA